MKHCKLFLAFLGLMATAPASFGQNSYPMLMSVHPVAVQVGKTSECQVFAQYSLSGAYQVFVSGEGVTAEVATPARETGGRRPGRRRQGGGLGVRFKVAPYALPGVRDVRIATPQGASTVGQLVIVRDPVVVEAASNDTIQTAQPVKLPATVCGTLERDEDVDYYKFSAAAGQALTFHLQCQRLQNRIHDLQVHADPIITLRNSAGTVLAANDNFFAGDPLLHYRFPSAGEYYLEVRDVRYSGTYGQWRYSIEINDRPFVTNVHPTRVTPGTSTRLQMVGFNLPADPTAAVNVPANLAEGMQWLPLTGAGNPAPVVVSRLPDVTEAAGDNNTPAKAQPVVVPAGISGRIETEGDVDCFAFDAKAGERFTFAIVAREHQSALDSNLRILDAKGNPLAENDDYRDRFTHTDSRIENWAAPANGRYVLEVRDLHLRGGPAFVYFLKATRSQPYFTLEIDTDKTPLAPGVSGVIFCRVARKDGFAGEVLLAIEGLPPGVTATCGRILATGTDGCILLKAAPDAKQAAANVRVTGTATVTRDGKPVTLTAVARPLQEIYMPGGGRYHYPVETHTVSVGKPLDIRAVRISPTAVSLKPGESKKIDIAIERAPGFKGNVTLDVVYQHLDTIYGSSLPPGFSVDDKASQTLLTGDQTKGHIVLKAAADAKPVKDQLVPIMAHVSINFVMKWTFCGEPLIVTVTQP